VAQLTHFGRAAHSSFLPAGNSIVAPSAIPIDNGSTKKKEMVSNADDDDADDGGGGNNNDNNNTGGGGMYDATGEKVSFQVPKELEISEIDEIVDDYVKAASLAKQAGFDGVEVHSGDGYLIDTFLQSSSNHRVDSYGGSEENRFRLLNRVVDAVSTIYPTTRIGVRLSPNGGYNDVGSEDNLHSFSYFIKMLGQKNLAYLDVIDGLALGFHHKCPPLTIEAIRQSFGTNPIVCNSGYDRDTAEKVLVAGDADAVMFGRPFIANPDLPYRYAYDLPLAADDPSIWYNHDEKGFSDFTKYGGSF